MQLWRFRTLMAKLTVRRSLRLKPNNRFSLLETHPLGLS
jgi:hypothetical protein